NHALDKDIYVTGFEGFSDHYTPYAAIIGIYCSFLAALTISSVDRLRPWIDGTLLFGCVVQALFVVFLPSTFLHQGAERHSGLNPDPNIVLLYILPAFFLSLRLRRPHQPRRFLRLGLWAAGACVVLAVFSTVSKMGLIVLFVSAAAAAMIRVWSQPRPKR